MLLLHSLRSKDSQPTIPSVPTAMYLTAPAANSAHESVALQMHGTGTALGDPVEAGAAAAVLSDPARPLALMASKTWSGHAEPAAGMVAMAHAQAALSGRQLLPLLHLRCGSASYCLHQLLSVQSLRRAL